MSEIERAGADAYWNNVARESCRRGDASGMGKALGELELMGAPSRPGYRGWTLLMEAAIFGSEACVEVAVEKRASPVDAADESGMTALMHAAMVCESSCLRLILAAGADARIQDKVGATALHLACESGNEDCSMLLAGKSDLWARNEDGLTCWESAREVGQLTLAERLKAMAWAIKDRLAIEKESAPSKGAAGPGRTL